LKRDNISDKTSTAVVTGASSGIGAAIATRLAVDGHDVVIVGRDARRLDATLQTVHDARPGAHRSVIADIATADGIRTVAGAVDSVDILVHSAGVFAPKPFTEITADQFDQLWAVNVRAPFLLTQALLEHHRAGSAIVFVSSISARVGMANQTAYGATKAAVEGLVRPLAVELAPRGIRVNAVAPGFIATPMNASLRADPADVTRRQDAILAGRLGTVDDIAAAVSYLASDAAAFVYGTTLPVDGGYPISVVQRGPNSAAAQP
jgi:NAD(P)-dependent dehydrogenase (short-subunit alcohol dehydrogenase family)